MSLVIGRTDDMLIIRGVNVFPSQVESVLVRFDELSPHYQLVVARPRTLDALEARIEVSPAWPGASGPLGPGASAAEALRDRIATQLRGVVGIGIEVTLAPPGTLPRSEGGKLRRVVDERAR